MDVQRFLTEKGVQFELVHHEQMFSAQEVAAVEHVTGHMFAKTVIVQGGGSAYMLVLPASRHADMKAAGKLVGAPVKMAGEQDMRALFPDCEVGAEPPFGSQYGIATYVDESMGAVDQIVFRAGAHDRTIRMSYDDYVVLEQPTIASFTVEG